MYRFKQFVNEVERNKVPEIDLDEASNMSASLAIKVQNDVIGFGRDAIRARSVEDKIKYLAKQNGALSGLVLMSIAVSGDKSFLGSLSKGLSLRKV